MEYDSIIALIGTCAAAASAVFAAVELHRSKKQQLKISDLNKKQNTINAFTHLQEQVIDKLVACSKEEMDSTIERINEDEYRIKYHQYRALIAKIEHFSVGVEENIYDFDTVDKLAGVYLIQLFYNVKPIIDKTRELDRDGLKYYPAFENLKDRLEEVNPDIVLFLEDSI